MIVIQKTKAVTARHLPRKTEVKIAIVTPRRPAKSGVVTTALTSTSPKSQENKAVFSIVNVNLCHLCFLVMFLKPYLFGYPTLQK